MHSAHKIEIVEKMCSELSPAERREFMAIHREYYSKTPAGFDALHRHHYAKMMERQPTSLAYFVKVDGETIAAALVLKREHPHQSQSLHDRWYSMAVNERKIGELSEGHKARTVLQGRALRELANRIISTTPTSWGTVEATGASSRQRISFFTKMHWRPATQQQELLERVKWVHPKEKYEFGSTPEGWLTFNRKNSIHLRRHVYGKRGRETAKVLRKTPRIHEYLQVLLVPKTA